MFIAILKLNMISFALNAALTPWGSTLSEYPGYITIVTTILLPFSYMQNQKGVKLKLYEETKAFLCMCFIVGISLAISIINTQIDQNYALAVLGFICMYATVSGEHITYSKKDLKQIFTINKLLCLTYILYAFFPLPIIKYTVYDNWGNTYFTLGFSNPNTTGVYIMFSIAMLVIEIAYENKRKRKAFGAVLALVLSYIIHLTESRTALVCSLLLILIAIAKNVPLKSWYVDVALALMIAFVGVQILLGTRSDIIFLGKSVASGRQNLYASFIASIIKNPWIFVVGNSGIYRLENAHNAAFAIVRNFGFLGLGCFIAFWRATIKHCSSSAGCTVNRMAIFVLLVYIIYSSTEAAQFIGMIPHGTPLILVARLAKDHLQT